MKNLVSKELNVKLVEFDDKTDLQVAVKVKRINNKIILEGSITGKRETLENIDFPEIWAESGRQHYLWNLGAFEMFVSGRDGAYTEYNFGFNRNYEQINLTGYREGQTLPEIKNPPIITAEFREGVFVQVVEFSEDVIGDNPFSLTATIKLRDGTELFFSNSHCGEAPNFHLECARVLRLDD